MERYTGTVCPRCGHRAGNFDTDCIRCGSKLAEYDRPTQLKAQQDAQRNLFAVLPRQSKPI